MVAPVFSPEYATSASADDPSPGKFYPHLPVFLGEEIIIGDITDLEGANGGNCLTALPSGGFPVAGQLKTKEIKEIEKVKENKYIIWEWIFGYSPAFSIHRIIQFNITGSCSH